MELIQNFGPSSPPRPAAPAAKVPEKGARPAAPARPPAEARARDAGCESQEAVPGRLDALEVIDLARADDKGVHAAKAEASLRGMMDAVGCPSYVMTSLLRKHLPTFEAFEAEGGSVRVREEEFLEDILRVMEHRLEAVKMWGPDKTPADAERFVRRNLKNAGLPREVIRAQLPAATDLFIQRLGNGHTEAHSVQLLARCFFKGYAEEPVKQAKAGARAKADKQAKAVARAKADQKLAWTYHSHLQNPDLSGALYVLSLLDKLDEKEARARAAAPARQQNPESKTSGWRHASVEDYGRAMREALEELAESDRAEVERCQDLYFQALQKENDELRRVLIPGHERIAEREARLH